LTGDLTGITGLDPIAAHALTENPTSQELRHARKRIRKQQRRLFTRFYGKVDFMALRSQAAACVRRRSEAVPD
jgi:hypothetical protein